MLERFDSRILDRLFFQTMRIRRSRRACCTSFYGRCWLVSACIRFIATTLPHPAARRLIAWLYVLALAVLTLTLMALMRRGQVQRRGDFDQHWPVDHFDGRGLFQWRCASLPHTADTSSSSSVPACW